MAGRRANVLDVREVVRRLRYGESNRRIARDVGIDRETVGKYREIAQEEGWLAGADLHTPEAIELRLAERAPRTVMGPKSSVEPQRDKLIGVYRQGVEIMAIWQILKEHCGYKRSYTKRAPPRPQASGGHARGLRPRGDGARRGSPGRLRLRGAHVGPQGGAAPEGMGLRHDALVDRHQYAEVVFDQKVET
jgi:hypothetical protein